MTHSLAATHSLQLRLSKKALAILLAVLLHGLLANGLYLQWQSYQEAHHNTESSPRADKDLASPYQHEGIEILLGAGRSSGGQNTTSGDDNPQQMPGNRPDPDQATISRPKTFGPELVLPSDIPQNNPEQSERLNPSASQPQPINQPCTESTVNESAIKESVAIGQRHTPVPVATPAPEDSETPEPTEASEPTEAHESKETPGQEETYEQEVLTEQEELIEQKNIPQHDQGDDSPSEPASSPLATSNQAPMNTPAEVGPQQDQANLPMASQAGRFGRNGNIEADQSGDGQPDNAALSSGQKARPKQASPADQPRSRDSKAALARYIRELAERLAQVKEYPKYAELKGDQGEAILFFVLNAQGQVTRSELKKSTGSWILDKEVLRMLERASPLPAFPSAVNREQLTLELPVSFYLEKK
ncbi:MAG: TonB family protein [Oceanobacter sp.]